MKKFGVIMAGGGGTRFWPLSTKSTPKQYLNLSGKNVMLYEAAARLAKVVGPDDIYVVTNGAQAAKARGVMRRLTDKDNVLVEPCARNTAACIGYAAAKILKTYGDAVMVITPSDATIGDEDRFAEALNRAAERAEQGGLVTVGITPTFPSTGYGYIRFGESPSRVKPVRAFVEKPDLATAEAYLKSGEYVWNSGMFVWKASEIWKAFQTYLPELFEKLMLLTNYIGNSDEENMVGKIYAEMLSVSIDYGIMEKAENIFVIPAEFGWSDVGSWDALGALHKADEKGNVTVGQTLALETENSVLYSGGKMVVALGLQDVVVVETPNAVLVCPKNRAQDVKSVTEALQKMHREDLL